MMFNTTINVHEVISCTKDQRLFTQRIKLAAKNAGSIYFHQSNITVAR